MRGLTPIIVAHIRNSYRLKVAVIVMFGLSVLLIAGLIALVCVLAIVPATRSAGPNAAEVSRYLALIVYGTGLLAMGMNINVFTANNLVREKAQRLVESILAGPVGVRTLWMAKSLAVFLPGLVLCEAFAIAAFLAVNTLIVAPRMAVPISPAMIFNGLALVPILYFPLCCLVLLVGLTGNPISGNVIANIAFSVLVTLVINLVTRGGLDVGSSLFTLLHLALTGVVGLTVLALQLRLTKERVVLSCKA
jgi:hypothetical protein